MLFYDFCYTLSFKVSCIILATTPVLLSFPFIWNIFFHPFIFSLCVSLLLKWVSCRHHTPGSCFFFIYSATLCLFIIVFSLHIHPINPAQFIGDDIHLLLYLCQCYHKLDDHIVQVHFWISSFFSICLSLALWHTGLITIAIIKYSFLLVLDNQLCRVFQVCHSSFGLSEFPHKFIINWSIYKDNCY